MPSPDRAAVMFRADAPVAGELALEVLLAGGERKKLTDAERRDLLARVRAGEHVELSFTARTFVQVEGKPNRNFVRFKPSALGKIARSFKGQPFLRDHGQYTIEDRGGTITASELVEVDGGAAFEMTVKAVKPWAVEGLLDGTIDRFSIGWHPTAPVLCSVHGKALRGREGCWCYPGATVDDQVVEAIFTAADGVEVSAVNVPAVPEAKGVEIRAALDALGATDNEAAPRRQEARMEKIIAILGLAAAATGDDITAAITALKDERDRLALELEAAKEKGSHFEQRLAALEADAKAAAESAAAEKVEARIRELKATGAIPLASDSGAEKLLRAAAARGGLAAFEEVAGDFKAGTFGPIGQPLQLDRVDKDKKGPAAAITPELKAALAACGLTEDDYLKYGPHKRALTGGN